jgi:lysine 2,3-aminomutase
MGANEDPWPHGKSRSIWRDVPEHEWHDWRWQVRHTIRSPEALTPQIPLSAEDVSAFQKLHRLFHFAVTPYYASLIDPTDPNDPIRRMILPSTEEASVITEGEIDPLGEKADQPAPGLTHRYPDRVLFVVTSYCSSYCRFCIRKRNWMGSDAARRKEDVEASLRYIKRHTEIRDVLISGGDPLTLPVDQLEFLFKGLRKIKHVEIVRLGSREHVMLPMRLLDDDLLRVLDRHGPIWLNTHFNHPREITPLAAQGIDRLIRAGVPVNNQSVLMRGVNDDPAVMKKLVQGLVRIKVRPYYLYQCDHVVGSGHLRTPVSRGIEIMESLRGHTTGFAVPTFVVDAPDGAGKIPVTPNYVVSQSPGRWVLRNYEGVMVRYEDGSDAKEPDFQAQPEPVGVSGLLTGKRRALAPEGLPRMVRRRKKAPAKKSLPMVPAAVLAHPSQTGSGSSAAGA